MSCTPLVMSITLVLATTSTLSLYHIGVVDHYGDPHHPVVHHLGIVDCPKIIYVPPWRFPRLWCYYHLGVVDHLSLKGWAPKKSGDCKKKLHRTVTPSSMSTLCGKLPASGPSPQQPRRGRPSWRLFRSQSVLCLLTSMVCVIVGVHD